MVRRPSSVLTRRRPGAGALALGAPLVALAYFLFAEQLPILPDGDETVLVAGGIGLLMIAASTLALLPARDTLVGPLLIVLGSGLLVAALNAGHVGAAANVAEAFLAGSLGLLLARALATPVVAVAVPLFVAAIDTWSVASGPSSRLLEGTPDPNDPLSFDLPAWGGLGSAGRLGLSDAVFLAMFAAWAWRYGFRRGATVVGLVLGLLASLLLGLLLDRAIPALPLIAAGYLLPNLDRVRDLLAHHEPGGARVSLTARMDLEEHTLESAGEHCEECGARLTERELELALERGGPTLCAIHAADVEPVEDEAVDEE